LENIRKKGLVVPWRHLLSFILVVSASGLFFITEHNAHRYIRESYAFIGIIFSVTFLFPGFRTEYGMYLNTCILVLATVLACFFDQGDIVIWLFKKIDPLAKPDPGFSPHKLFVWAPVSLVSKWLFCHFNFVQFFSDIFVYLFEKIMSKISSKEDNDKNKGTDEFIEDIPPHD
jgi:hypothetical protein